MPLLFIQFCLWRLTVLCAPVFCSLRGPYSNKAFHYVYFTLLSLLLYHCDCLTNGLFSWWGRLMNVQWEWPVTREMHQYSSSSLKEFELLTNWCSWCHMHFVCPFLFFCLYSSASSLHLFLIQDFLYPSCIDKCMHASHYVHDTAPLANHRPVDFCWCKGDVQNVPSVFHHRTTDWD